MTSTRWARVRDWSRGRFRLWAPPGMPTAFESLGSQRLYFNGWIGLGPFWMRWGRRSTWPDDIQPDDMIQPDGMIQPVEPPRESH
jgi:hypothetical protein